MLTAGNGRILGFEAISHLSHSDPRKKPNLTHAYEITKTWI